MPTTIQRSSTRDTTALVRPSIVPPENAKPFTLEQELEPFGKWVGDPIWVPPKDGSEAMAETMLASTRPFASRAKRWATVVENHRDEFTQVRELNLFRPSIRLPQGRILVSVTEQQHFDQITDEIPNCVQTRLQEFLDGPGKQRGVKVYYLKPLCVDFCDHLILTSPEDVDKAISKVQREVFAEYRLRASVKRPVQALGAVASAGLAVPRFVGNYFVQRRQKAIDAYQARLEFKRRKTALRAVRAHRQCRTDGCTFDEMLELTTPLDREHVVQQYGVERKRALEKRSRLVRMAVGAVPWFVLLSLGASTASAGTAVSLISTAAPIMVCDPAFVAEMPGSEGVLLKIGHFDEVDGVTHVEI